MGSLNSSSFKVSPATHEYFNNFSDLFVVDSSPRTRSFGTMSSRLDSRDDDVRFQVLRCIFTTVTVSSGSGTPTINLSPYPLDDKVFGHRQPRVSSRRWRYLSDYRGKERERFRERSCRVSVLNVLWVLGVPFLLILYLCPTQLIPGVPRSWFYPNLHVL